jgi:methylated-DNA-[protein]-cysteine S-methyltransferase
MTTPRERPDLRRTYTVAVPSGFGELAIEWQDTPEGPLVARVLLPNEVTLVSADASLHSCPAISDLAERVQRFLGGENVTFELDLIPLERCPPFQRRVLRAEYGIPRGWVSTYGRIARHLGVPRGARAVGNALAHNPFPIVIPCHRAIRSDGHLGGFRGGATMKRALLELEGIAIAPNGKAVTEQVHY